MVYVLQDSYFGYIPMILELKFLQSIQLSCRDNYLQFEFRSPWRCARFFPKMVWIGFSLWMLSLAQCAVVS